MSTYFAARIGSEANMNDVGGSPEFGEVVAYIEGVAAAITAMRSDGHSTASSGWAALSPAPSVLRAADSYSPRLTSGTLRCGEASGQASGGEMRLRVRSTGSYTPERGGARVVDLEGVDGFASERTHSSCRYTLPYGLPALSVVPVEAPGIATDWLTDREERAGTSLPYRALAMSWVPLGPQIGSSSWPAQADERVTAIRLRCAPPSEAWFAATGTHELGAY